MGRLRRDGGLERGERRPAGSGSHLDEENGESASLCLSEKSIPMDSVTRRSGISRWETFFFLLLSSSTIKYRGRGLRRFLIAFVFKWRWMRETFIIM